MSPDTLPSVGDRVVHRIFGPGVVTAISKRRVVSIAFDRSYAGSRELGWAFAALNTEPEIKDKS